MPYLGSERNDSKCDDSRKWFVYQDGRFYFTRLAERKFYFILTVAMLLAGILYKLGVL